MVKALLDFLRISRIDGRIALRNGIGAALAFVVGTLLSDYWHRPNPIVSSMWICMTTILVLQAHLGGTYRAAWARFLGLIVGTCIGTIAASITGTDAPALGIAVFASVITCSLLSLQESYRIATATVVVIMVLGQINQDVEPWLFGLFRFIDSTCGIIIAVGIAHVIWPFHARTKLRCALAGMMRDLARLYRLVSLTEEPNENQRHATLELIKNIDKVLYDNRQVLDDSKAELLTRTANIVNWEMLINRCEELFDQVLSIRHAFRPSTLRLLDQSLHTQWQEVIDHVNTSFYDIADMLETGVWSSGLPDITLSLQKLKEELTRFRNTHATREFSIEDVEAFFVFFYSLKSLLETLKRIETTIHTLISDRSIPR